MIHFRGPNKDYKKKNTALIYVCLEMYSLLIIHENDEEGSLAPSYGAQ